MECETCKYWKKIGVKNGGFLMGKCKKFHIEMSNESKCSEYKQKKETKGD
jgi:cytoskeletal protein CcmA (bactofilin family)